MIIYDHDDEVVCADVRAADNLLASMDIQGTVLIRSLNDPETVLHTITSIPKEVEDFARILFNNQRPVSDGALIAVINGQIMLMDLSGRQSDADTVKEEMKLLKVDNSAVIDNKFLYKLLCLQFRGLLANRWDYNIIF